MGNENLFQVFSQVFIESQQIFSKTDVELRSKCRILSEKLSRLVEELENDAFSADLSTLSMLEEETLQILRACHALEDRRAFIQESVSKLKDSTKTKIGRR